MDLSDCVGKKRIWWILLNLIEWLTWQYNPSSPRDPGSINSRDVSPQPECLKGRSWPIYVPEARKDHERDCTISSRGREIIFHYSRRISISSTSQPRMKPEVNKNPRNKWWIFMIGFAEQNKSVACHSVSIISTSMGCWTTDNFPGRKILDFIYSTRLTGLLVMEFASTI